MKKLILGLFIAVSLYSNAQETEFTFTAERGMTDFIVTPVEGKTATEIYKKVIDWIKVTYKNPNEVILSTIENEYLRFEGISDISTYKCKYQIEISIKEGKYKFDLIGLQVYVGPNQSGVPVGWNDFKAVNFIKNSTKESLENMYKKDGTYRAWVKYVPEFLLYFNNLNKSLSESIVSNVKKSDGW
jgi:hypothetical protein